MIQFRSADLRALWISVDSILLCWKQDLYVEKGTRRMRKESGRNSTPVTKQQQALYLETFSGAMGKKVISCTSELQHVPEKPAEV